MHDCAGDLTSCYDPQKWVYPHNVRKEIQKKKKATEKTEIKVSGRITRSCNYHIVLEYMEKVISCVLIQGTEFETIIQEIPYYMACLATIMLF